MPIVDVEVVCQTAAAKRLPSASGLASALGRAFVSAPGRTWVRVRALDASCYAENDAPVAIAELPVFVTVLRATLPIGAALQTEVASVTQAVAARVEREAERVHLSYAPAGVGRQAFGGHLVQRAAANPSLQPARYGWLRWPPRAAELKRCALLRDAQHAIIGK